MAIEAEPLRTPLNLACWFALWWYSHWHWLALRWQVVPIEGGVGHLICSSAYVAMAITEFTSMPIEASKKPLDHHSLRRAPSRLLPKDLKEELHARREVQKRLGRASTIGAVKMRLNIRKMINARRVAPVPTDETPTDARAYVANARAGRHVQLPGVSSSSDNGGGALALGSALRDNAPSADMPPPATRVIRGRMSTSALPQLGEEGLKPVRGRHPSEMRAAISGSRKGNSMTRMAPAAAPAMATPPPPSAPPSPTDGDSVSFLGVAPSTPTHPSAPPSPTDGADLEEQELDETMVVSHVGRAAFKSPARAALEPASAPELSPGPPATPNPAALSQSARLALASELQTVVLNFAAGAADGSATLSPEELINTLAQRISTKAGLPIPSKFGTPAPPALRTPSISRGREESSDHGPESVSTLLWRRLISRHSMRGWAPPPNHVLVCGGVERMSRCVEQLLRVAKPMGTHVVALVTVPQTESAAYHTWVSCAGPLLSSAEDALTIVRGSELNSDDLNFAGATSARAVLIFAPVIEGGSNLDAHKMDVAKQTADCTTVLTALRVRHVSHAAFTLCEMHEGANARFFRLTANGGLTSNSWRKVQMLAKRTASVYYLGRSGSAGRDSMQRGSRSSERCSIPAEQGTSKFGTLLRHAQLAQVPPNEKGGSFNAGSFNAGSFNAGSSWKKRKPQKSESESDDAHIVRARSDSQMKMGLSKLNKGAEVHLSRAFAGGHVFTEGLLDRLMCESYYNPRIPQVLNLLLQLSGSAGAPQLHLRPVPPKLRGKTFYKVYSELLRVDGVQPIALYRTSKDDKKQSVEYIFTKPNVDTVVHASDYIFALGHLDAGQKDEWRASAISPQIRTSSPMHELVKAAKAAKAAEVAEAAKAAAASGSSP